ncbi:MAG TPA: metal-dependent hydrolase [Sedimentibacter sp.]|jgi:L-ascorbate metabolism protein UlaG (beta-lactamase superfamily)|nr:metal-dependent hydrolase [Clostridiales bacterium]HQK54257.1 metal-dependent hydrolase [Sedimentibacter sp.]
MKLTFLGHSALLIEEGNFKGLVDPFITGNSLSKISVDDLVNITHIFVTHGHGDHIGDTINIAKRNKALIITNHEISAYLSKFKLRTHAMHIGGRTKFDFGTVKMTNALHGSGISENGNMIYGGNPGGFIIEVNGKKIYHAGDTGLTYDMKLLEDEKIDVAFLPIGGNYTMDIEDAIKAVDFIKPKTVVPMHYNTFGIIKADPEIFKSKASSNVIILNVNESMNV